MKKLNWIAFFFSLCIVYASAGQKQDIEAFVAKVSTACKAKDFEAIKALSYYENVPPILVDCNVYGWEEVLNSSWRNDLVFAEAEYKSLNEYTSDPNMNQKAIESMIRPMVMNGHSYGPNLEVIGFVNIVSKSKDGKSSVGSLQPIGIAPDGSIRFVCKTRK